jgi:hypothetical protein
MPTSRSLELVNESPLAGQMAVYLKDPKKTLSPCFSLVWLSRTCGPGRSVRLSWDEDFGLTCGAAAEPGLVFSGGEIQPAGPGAESFRLGRSASGYSLAPVIPAGPAGPAGMTGDDEYVPEDIAAGFVLSLKPGEKRRSLSEMVRDRPARPESQARPGRFQILVEPDAPPLAVALCLAGRPALLCPAEPGRTISFPARPSFGALFGSFEPGLVLDLDQVMLTTELEFTGGSLRAVFKRDCAWVQG